MLLILTIVCQVSLSERSRTELHSLLDKLRTAVTGELLLLLYMTGLPSGDGVKHSWRFGLSPQSHVITVVVDLQCDVEDNVMCHPVLQGELNNPKNGDSAHKHLKQQVQKNVTHLNHILLQEAEMDQV